ncbi:MAG: hypothetical protein Q9173_005405 [Seirophora scorigena]
MSKEFLEQVEQYRDLITDAVKGIGKTRRQTASLYYSWDEIKPLLQDSDELPGVDRKLVRNVIQQMDLLVKLNRLAMVDHMSTAQADTDHRLMIHICRCLYLIFFHRESDIKDGEVNDEDTRDKDAMVVTLGFLKDFMPAQTQEWAGTVSSTWQDGTFHVIAYLEVRLGVTLSELVQCSDIPAEDRKRIREEVATIFSAAMRVLDGRLKKGTLPATNIRDLFNEVGLEAMRTTIASSSSFSLVRQVSIIQSRDTLQLPEKPLPCASPGRRDGTIFTENAGRAHDDYANILDSDWEDVIGEVRMLYSADFTRWNKFETLLMHPTSTEGLDRDTCRNAYFQFKFLYHCHGQLYRHQDPEQEKPRINDHDYLGSEDKAAFNDTLTAMSDFMPNNPRVNGFLYFHLGLDMVVEYLCLRLGYYIRDVFRTLTRGYDSYNQYSRDIMETIGIDRSIDSIAQSGETTYDKVIKAITTHKKIVKHDEHVLKQVRMQLKVLHDMHRKVYFHCRPQHTITHPMYWFCLYLICKNADETIMDQLIDLLMDMIPHELEMRMKLDPSAGMDKLRAGIAPVGLYLDRIFGRTIDRFYKTLKAEDASTRVPVRQSAIQEYRARFEGINSCFECGDLPAAIAQDVGRLVWRKANGKPF